MEMTAGKNNSMKAVYKNGYHTFHIIHLSISDKPLNSPFLKRKVILVKGIVHSEINFWHVLAYLKGIQDAGVFASTVFSTSIFLGQTILVCQSYHAGLWSPPQKACTEKSKLNMI